MTVRNRDRARQALPDEELLHLLSGHADLDEMVRQNFNTIICFDLRASDLADINAHGLKTMPCLRDPNMRPTWMSLQNDPAIIGWYTHDEPEGQGVSADQALIDYQWSSRRTPLISLVRATSSGDAFNNYRASDDFSISDCYCITDPFRQPHPHYQHPLVDESPYTAASTTPRTSTCSSSGPLLRFCRRQRRSAR